MSFHEDDMNIPTLSFNFLANNHKEYKRFN